MEENVTIVTVLEELRDFRKENNERWNENDKKWEQNEKRWEENDKRWEQNEKRWEENNKKWEQNTKTLMQIQERITAEEEGRKKDRRDLIEILDTMEKTISNQFVEMKEYFDAKFDKVFAAQRLNDIENEQFKRIICAHEKRLNFYNARVNRLEEWKEQFDMGEFTAV